MSITSIANMALRRLGTERINDLTENKPRAIMLNESKDYVRRVVLENGNWTFARERVKLTSIVGTPAFEYTNKFQLPSDCIRPLYEYNEAKYKVEGRYILSDESSLDLVYIKDISDDSQFSPTFIKAYYLMWAIELSYSIIQSEVKLAQLKSEYDEVLNDARFNDSTASSPDEYDVSTFLNSRA